MSYNANGGSGTPSATSVSDIPPSTTSQSVVLSSTKPTRPSYSFVGWATSNSASTAEYQAGDTITVSQSDPSLSLYAVWKTTVAMADNANMQDMTAESCQNASSDTAYTLKDSRTDKTYLVGKLADGNCWMLQNLYFPSSITLSSSDSDVSSDYTLPTSNTSGWTDGSVAYFFIGSHRNATADSSSNRGSFFSHLAATAGTGTDSTQYSNASSSVCPKNWKLPTAYTDSGGTGQFKTLFDAYSSISNFKTAFKYSITALCDKKACPNSDIGSYYRSSTFGYCQLIASSQTNPTYPLNGRYGYSVRCILAS